MFFYNIVKIKKYSSHVYHQHMLEAATYSVPTTMGSNCVCVVVNNKFTFRCVQKLVKTEAGNWV